MPWPWVCRYWGNHLGHRHGLAHRHGGTDLDAHVPAAGGEELRCHLVGAAQHQLDVTVANDLRPQVIGITVLELSQTLHRQHHVDPPAADDREGAGEVRTVRCAAQLANVVELIQDQVHRHRAAHLRVLSAKRTSLMNRKEKNRELRNAMVASWSLRTTK